MERRRNNAAEVRTCMATRECSRGKYRAAKMAASYLHENHGELLWKDFNGINGVSERRVDVLLFLVGFQRLRLQHLLRVNHQRSNKRRIERGWRGDEGDKRTIGRRQSEVSEIRKEVSAGDKGGQSRRRRVLTKVPPGSNNSYNR